MSVHKQHLPSFRRRPESSKPLNSLDPGLRRDDVVSGIHAFLDGYRVSLFSISPGSAVGQGAILAFAVLLLDGEAVIAQIGL